jgi:hypothetical protein
VPTPDRLFRWFIRDRRAGDAPILVADPAKFESQLGFKAMRPDLGKKQLRSSQRLCDLNSRRLLSVIDGALAASSPNKPPRKPAGRSLPARPPGGLQCQVGPARSVASEVMSLSNEDSPGCDRKY